MRLYLAVLAIVIICFGVLPAGCRQQTAAQQAPTTANAQPKAASEPDILPPKIDFEDTVHDFGEVGKGIAYDCQFDFKNTGEGTLKIKGIKSTCGCTVPELAKKEYAPGESGTIKVRYNSGSKAGSVTRRLYVNTNDRTNPKVPLVIKAKVIEKISYKPSKLKLSLDEENAGCPPIQIKSLDGELFAIKQFKSTANAVTVDFDPNAQGTVFILGPKVDMEKLRKLQRGTINIKLTHPEHTRVNIPFDVLAEFRLNPPTIVLLNAKPAEPVKRELWILNNYNRDFEIESTSSQKGLIEVLEQKKKDNSYKFGLQITPPATDGKTRVFSDVFVVNIKGGAKLEVSCRGFYSRK